MQIYNFLLIYKNYSHRKALISIENILSSIDFKINVLSFDELSSMEYLLKFDLLVLSMGGKYINSIMDFLFDYDIRPSVITMFPGIVVDEQLNAYITRLRSDLVLLNSKHDEAIYKKICKVFNREYNGFLYGAGWYKEVKLQSDELSKNIVFFEQIDVPHGIENRMKLIGGLLKFASRNINYTLVIKPRNEHIENEFSIVKLLERFKVPSNVKINYDDVDTLIQNMSLGLTVSSSVVIEVLLANKKVILIEDFKSKENFSQFFKDSNLFVYLSSIDLANIPKVSNKWFCENITNPYTNKNKLISKLNSIDNFFFKVNNINVKRIKLVFSFFYIYIKDFKKILKSTNNAIKMIKGKNE